MESRKAYNNRSKKRNVRRYNWRKGKMCRRRRGTMKESEAENGGAR